jgi:hypothetical protein
MTTRHQRAPSHRTAQPLPNASPTSVPLVDAESHDLLDPIEAARKWWLPIALSMIVGALVGLYWAGEVQVSYESEATVLVGPVVPNADLLEGTADLARTYGEVVESAGVIARAVVGTGVRAGDVTVSAQAGRGSATLAIRVRTPSRSMSPVITTRLIDELRDVVADNRTLLSESSWGTLDGADARTGAEPFSTFPIGAAITLLDDADRSARTSLDPSQGAALGALAAGLLTFVFGTTAESRRRVLRGSAMLSGAFGDDLGVIPSPPALADLLRYHRGRTIARDVRARMAVQLGADSVWLCATGAHDRQRRSPVVAVAVPNGSPRYLRAFWQLCDGLPTTPLVIDPTGVATRWLSRATQVPNTRPVDVVVDGATIALLASSGTDVDAVDGVDVILVLVPFDEGASTWSPLAQRADGVLVVLGPSDFASSAMRVRLDQLRRLNVPILGAAVLSRRLFSPSPQRIELVNAGRLEDGDGPSLDDERAEGLER